MYVCVCVCVSQEKSMVIMLPIMDATKLFLTTLEIKDIIYRTFRLPMCSL